MVVVSAEPRLGLTRSDPKPAKRYRATPAEWKYMRSLLLVEPCAICGGRSESLHHIYKRGQGGGDLLVNLAPVCGSGTTGCHGKLEARDPEALATLGRWIGVAFITYLASVLGDTDRAWAWVDRNLNGNFRSAAPSSPPAPQGAAESGAESQALSSAPPLLARSLGPGERLVNGERMYSARWL